MKLITAATVALGLVTGSAVGQTARTDSGPAEVAKAVKSLVEREFYKPVPYPAFDAATVTLDDIDQALASFGTSHTARFAPGSIDYVELADILRGPMRKDLERIFPPRAEPTYAGIGMVTRQVGWRRFVSDVYDGSPAARAGILAGDEILAVDGKPFDEIVSFRGRAGSSVDVRLRRNAGEPPRTLKTQVVNIRPTEMFYNAINQSMRVIEQDGLSIAYIRFWALGSHGIERAVTQALLAGSLKDADGLVVDLRGRWGGMFNEVPDLLVVNQPQVSFTDRKGDTSYHMGDYSKPVVAIIDEGSRSAQEMFAQLLRKNGVELVGRQTPGAVLATRAFVLPDNSLLVLPIAEVRIDGETLEGKGVKPDHEVSYTLPYAAGRDAQKDAALDAMERKLCAIAAHAHASACSVEKTAN